MRDSPLKQHIPPTPNSQHFFLSFFCCWLILNAISKTQEFRPPPSPSPISPSLPPKKKKKRTTSNNSTTNNISIQHHNIQQPTWAPTQNKNAPNTKRFPSKKTKHHRASIGRKLDQPYGFKPEIGTTLTLGVDGA